MKYILIALLTFPLALQSQTCIGSDAEKFYDKAMDQINVRHIDWIKQTVSDIESNKSKTSDIPAIAGSYKTKTNLQSMDIDALIALVLMQISKDADADLRSLLDEMKKQNEEKKKMRDAVKNLKEFHSAGKEMSRKDYDSLRNIADTNTARTNKTSMMNPRKASLAEIHNLLDYLRDKLDSYNEMSEEMSLRLQVYMDRRNRILETLSNIMKKFSETSDTIIQNLK